MEMEFGAQSDTGCIRENNEDSFRVAPDISLFVLSDGMGGLAFGEVASRLSVDIGEGEEAIPSAVTGLSTWARRISRYAVGGGRRSSPRATRRNQ